MLKDTDRGVSFWGSSRYIALHMDPEWQLSPSPDDSEGSPINGYQFSGNGSGGAHPSRGNDSVREYLQAIGRIRLLTAEEEISDLAPTDLNIQPVLSS